MEDKVVKELNAVLKGEEIAIESYDRFINDVTDEKVRDELLEIQKDHKTHADKIAERIQDLGGKPEHSTGFMGFMASAKAAMQGIKGMGTADILKKACDGEDKGITMAEEIIKGDLDEESRSMISSILSTDHSHLSRMLSLLSDYDEGRMQ